VLPLAAGNTRPRRPTDRQPEDACLDPNPHRQPRTDTLNEPRGVGLSHLLSNHAGLARNPPEQHVSGGERGRVCARADLLTAHERLSSADEGQPRQRDHRNQGDDEH